MARGKKAAQGLTPEEKLAQVLVPMEEQPYQIPENWCWTRLLGVIVSSDEKTEDFSNLELKYVGLENLEKDGGIIGYGSPEGIKSLKNVFHSGQILYGKLRPYLNKHDIATFDGICSTDILVFSTREPVLPQIVNYYFNQSKFIEYAVGNSKGINLPRVSENVILNAVFPLPPLAEQHRIVDRIESIFAKLDEAKEKAQAVVDGFELRKSAILHKAFTGELTAKWREEHRLHSNESFECVQKELLKINRKKIKKVINNSTLPEIPSEWKYVELDEVAKQITDGEHSTPERVDDYCGYYLLSARNVRDDAMKLDDVDYISQKEYERISRRCNPQKGDVLISCSGSVGRVCVINDDNYYAMVRSAAMVSVVKCNPRFIMYMIMAEPVQREIQQLSKQTAQANLFIGAIAALKIPFAAVEEQNEIVYILDSLIKKEQQAKAAAESVLDQIDTIKKAVLARAFRGELGTNDPAEASAVELLKTML